MWGTMAHTFYLCKGQCPVVILWLLFRPETLAFFVPQRIDTSWTRLNSLSVPCFPLHNRPRLPFEEVSLNLYEPRYLALADSVLSQSNRTFGTLFTANLPHYIRNGVGPPTPMVSSGEIGVFCEMTHSREVLMDVPLLGRKRKLMTKSAVVGRFIVDRVIRDGREYHHLPGDGGDNCFIVLEVTPLEDELPSERDELDEAAEAERTLWRELQELEASGAFKESTRNVFENAIRFAPGAVAGKCGLEFSYTSGVFTLELTQNASAADLAVDTGFLSLPEIVEARRRERFSFAAASALELTLEDREWVLATTDTTARLRLCIGEIQVRKFSWMAAERALRRLFLSSSDPPEELQG